jgi:hypothetical protein
MATRDEIKNAILKTAGNPSAGIIVDIADDLAKAIWELENKSSHSPAKEARVVESKETR